MLAVSSGDVPYSAVESAFKSGNAKAISDLGKEKTLINVLGSEGVYSRPQATLVLKDFFSKNPGSSFNYIHKGKGSSEGSFAIGKYVSRGKEFRVTIHFKKINGKFRIESLAIEN